jgi:hypothetical protein
MKTIFLDLFIFISFSIFFSSCTNPAIENNQLLTLDSKKIGSDNMEIVIKETQFINNIAPIEETIYKRGSAAGASMFGMCGFTILAKKRGFSHYVMLEHTSSQDCNGCEWSSISRVGYLKNVKPTFVKSIGSFNESNLTSKNEIQKYLSEQFPQQKFTND